jgi:flagellum-specific ATP synthase
MVKPTIAEIRASDLTPLEQELALASFGAEALADEPQDAPRPHAAPRTAAPRMAAPHDPRHGHSTGAFAAASRDATQAAASAAAAARPEPNPALANNPHVNAWRAHLDGLRARNAIARPMRACGRLTRAAGLVLEAVGLRLSVGAEVMIELPQGSSLPMAEAEVVGFAGDKLFPAHASIRSRAPRSPIRWRAPSGCRWAGNCSAVCSTRRAGRSTGSGRSAQKWMPRFPRPPSIR